MVVYEQLPSQANIRIAKSLPEYIKISPMPKVFKACLVKIRTKNACCNIDEFLADIIGSPHNWSTDTGAEED